MCMVYSIVLCAGKVTTFEPKLYTKLRKAIFSVFHNISQPKVAFISSNFKMSFYCCDFVDRVWTKVKDLLPGKAGEKVLVRGRLHTSRGTGKK